MKRMKVVLETVFFVIASILLSIEASGQVPNPPGGFIAPVAMGSLGPSGFAYTRIDSSGNLVVSGNPGLAPITGYVPPFAPIGYDSAGAPHFLLVDNSGNLKTTSTGGGGGATSVGLALPASLFSVTNSPVTTTGTLTGSFIAISPHTYLGNNTSGSAVAALVIPVCSDLSDASASCSTDATNASNISSGSLPNARFATPFVFTPSSDSTSIFQIDSNSGTVLLDVDSTNKRIIVGGSAPISGTTFQVVTAQPASVGTTPGALADQSIRSIGATGGNTTIATTGTGGNGSRQVLAGGAGGQATAAATASTGGAGGDFTVLSGAGGPASVAGTGTNNGGTGADVVLTAGAGGAANGATNGVNTGGTAGVARLTGGAGGAATTGSGTLNGANGGSAIITGGAAGLGTNSPAGGSVQLLGGAAAASAGSLGGGVTIQAGAGSATGTGGAGGSTIVQSGAAGGSGGNNGGNVTITVGQATGAGTAGSFLVQTSASTAAPATVLTINGSAVTPTLPIREAAGAVGAPSYSFSSDTNSGFYSRGSGFMNIASGGVNVLGFAAAGGNTLVINQTACMGWPTSGDATNANTTTLCGSGVVRTLQHGANQSGTNTAASSQSVQPGAGTGNTTPATWQVNGPAIGASGSAVQTQVTRLAVNDFKALTSGVAATLVSIPLAADQVTGGSINFTARATDTVNHLNCSTTGEVTYSAENSAGVFVTSASVLGTSASACTATVTDTCTFAMTGANPTLLQATCTLVNMASPTSFNIVYTVDHHGDTLPTL